MLMENHVVGNYCYLFIFFNTVNEKNCYAKSATILREICTIEVLYADEKMSPGIDVTASINYDDLILL